MQCLVSVYTKPWHANMLLLLLRRPAADDVRDVVTPMYRKATSNNIISVTVHRTAVLQPDVLLTNPVVRVHVVSAATGEYIRMPHQQGQQLQQLQPDQQQLQPAGASEPLRHVVAGNEQAEVNVTQQSIS